MAWIVTSQIVWPQKTTTATQPLTAWVRPLVVVIPESTTSLSYSSAHCLTPQCLSTIIQDAYKLLYVCVYVLIQNQPLGYELQEQWPIWEGSPLQVAHADLFFPLNCRAAHPRTWVSSRIVWSVGKTKHAERNHLPPANVDRTPQVDAFFLSTCSKGLPCDVNPSLVTSSHHIKYDIISVCIYACTWVFLTVIDCGGQALATWDTSIFEDTQGYLSKRMLLKACITGCSNKGIS